MDLNDWIVTADTIKTVLPLHKTSILFTCADILYSHCLSIAANLQTRESCLKLLRVECDYREWIFLYISVDFIPGPWLRWLAIKMSRSWWETPDDSANNSSQGKPFFSALKISIMNSGFCSFNIVYQECDKKEMCMHLKLDLIMIYLINDN